MAACEKCWGDAYKRMITTGLDQAECYKQILFERREEPCSPEEQAGEGATKCPKCKKYTMHIYCHVCMNCGYKSVRQKNNIVDLQNGTRQTKVSIFSKLKLFVKRWTKYFEFLSCSLAH